VISKFTVFRAATVKSVGVMVADVKLPAVAVKNIPVNFSSIVVPEEFLVRKVKVSVVWVESGLVKPDKSIWKKVLAPRAWFRVAIMVRVEVFPVHETVMVEGSTIDHDKTPFAIDVVKGTTISNEPPASTEFTVVEKRARVVVALTCVLELCTPTFPRVAQSVFRINRIQMNNTTNLIKEGRNFAILNSK
jgi:hypothetical protein